MPLSTHCTLSLPRGLSICGGKIPHGFFERRRNYPTGTAGRNGPPTAESRAGPKLKARTTDSDHVLTPLTAQQTLDRAKSVLQSGRGAGLPELLKLIESLSTDIQKVTIGELVELIEKDAAVMARVLSVANTLAHNPGIAPLSSLTHAIHQIGFQRIRSLAISLMLIESTGRDGNPPEQREAATEALCAGLIAQGCAQSLGSVEPELAFACATLRQFGRIVLPVVSLELYREAKALCADRSENAAFKDRFGLTPLELTRHLLAAVHLPDEVMATLQDCHPESMDGIATRFDARLLGIADFGGQLARCALDGKLRPDAFAEQSQRLARRFDRLLPGATELIGPAMVHTDARLASFSRCNGVSALPAANLKRIHARVVDAAEAAANAAEIPTADVVEVPDKRTDSGTTVPFPLAAVSPPAAAAEFGADRGILRRSDLPEPEIGLADLPAPAPARGGDLPVTDTWTVALEHVRANFVADECWAFLKQPGGQSLPLVCGTGENWQAFQAHAALRSDERTVFGVCLSLRGNVVIHDTGETRLAPYLPEWFHGGGRPPGAFVLVPLHDGVKANGLVLIGWQRAQRLNLSVDQTEFARQLLAQVNARARAA